MVDRTLLAGVLGVALGLALVAFPAAVVRVHLVVRAPPGKGSEYGEAYRPPEKWLWVVRAIGVVMVALGTYFGHVALG